MNFKQYLDTLKLSAKEAVVDGEQASLSDLKKYLHIERPVERDLSKLVQTAAIAESPQLIFLMGNVGDGKSHLLAKMWELHPEEMQLFDVYNDATESINTKISYLQRLQNVFAPYSDQHLEAGDVIAKTIIAINLGTLTNFLEESGEGFERLKAFVQGNQLIERKVRFDQDQHDDCFLALNLTDYHIFALGADGLQCRVLTDIVERVTKRDPINPFFEAYQAYYEQHAKPDQCPIKYNFDFLSQPAVQQSLSDLLVKVVLADKLIVSVRLLMNWLYDLIVSPELSSLSLEEITERISLPTFASEFYRHTLPVLLFESSTTSFVLKSLQAYDPVSTTNEQLEMLLIKLGSSTNPAEYFTRYGLLQPNTLIFKLVPLLESSQKLQLFLRLHYLLRLKDEFTVADQYFKEFLKNLYWFNSGQLSYLLPFYNQVQTAIYQWNGSAGVGNDYINLNVGRKQGTYKISQKLQLQPSPAVMTKIDGNQTLQKFTDFLLIGYKIGSLEEPFELEVDYHLYQLIRYINEGYRPNRIDKSIHLKFSQFVDNLINYESQTKELVIQEFTGEVRKKFKLQFNAGFDHFNFSPIE